jgi:hypothetical protein
MFCHRRLIENDVDGLKAVYQTGNVQRNRYPSGNGEAFGIEKVDFSDGVKSKKTVQISSRRPFMNKGW